MRIAVFTTNDPQNYSGGRYHALMLAYATAAAGFETVMITDHIPAFDRDLSILSSKRNIHFHKTVDFRKDLPQGNFDVVVIVPTGIFHPEFYENGLAFAGNSGAVITLINFEAGSWFNSLAPEPKDIRLWSYWQRVLAEGGICLSSARESAKWAKEFYRARKLPIRHEVWSPPINSTAARQFDKKTKDGSALAFVRPMDRHKGAQDLLILDRNLFKGRTLHLIAGREPGAEFEQAIRDHFGSACQVQIHTRVSDVEKFALLSSAQVVLFPSRFEGFGYPPVEAAYCGTESVCFSLPVLEETVGRIAHFAPIGDFEGFNTALAVALKQSERRGELRHAVEHFAAFDPASELLAEIFTRSIEHLPRRTPTSNRILIGPFNKTPPRKLNESNRDQLAPPYPAVVTGLSLTDGGDFVLSVNAFVPTIHNNFTAKVEGELPSHLATIYRSNDGAWSECQFHIIVPENARGKIITIAPGNSTDADTISVKIDELTKEPRRLKTLFGLSEKRPIESGIRLRGWILADRPVSALHVSANGIEWFTTPINTERKDIAQKYPDYPSSKCGFIIDLPADITPENGLMILLEQDAVIVDVISGWMPSARPLFEIPKREMKPTVKAPAPDSSGGRATDAVATKASSPPLASEPIKHPLTLSILDITDQHWNRGILRKGNAVSLATILISPPPQSKLLTTGMAIRFASGAMRRITQTEVKETGYSSALMGLSILIGTVGETPIRSSPIRNSTQPKFPFPSLSGPTKTGCAESGIYPAQTIDGHFSSDATHRPLSACCPAPN